MAQDEATRKNKTKKAKRLVDTVWEHYRNFLDSCEEEGNEDGDLDELEEILSLLEPSLPPSASATTTTTTTSWGTTMESLLPLLCSVAHYRLACAAVSQTVDVAKEDNNDDNHNGASTTLSSSAMVRQHLTASLGYFPDNSATWSMGANYARMTQTASPRTICQWYQHAARCASRVRQYALSLMEKEDEEEEDDDDDNNNKIKEWIELLVLDGITGTYYMSNDDEDDEKEQKEDKDATDEANEDDDDDDDGYYGSSAVEATSRFMSAMLLSTLGDHQTARTNLQHFDLTHRLHPHVWTGKTTNKNNNNKERMDQSLLLPCVYNGGNVLPERIYQRMCRVFAPDATYWEESDYAHRGYFSFLYDLCSKPTNLVERVIVDHLLPLAQRHTEETIVGAEWWTHTRPIQANLGHNLHFDTDETGLAREGSIRHPVLSSVLYLTTGNTNDHQKKKKNKDSPNAAGATIVLDQTPDSTEVAKQCWICQPQDNSFMIFPGNLLHGVLPCRGKTNDDVEINGQEEEEEEAPKMVWDKPTTTTTSNRLTFMVGFWTHHLGTKTKPYGPCGPLPSDAQWVQEIGKDDDDDDVSSPTKAPLEEEATPLPQIQPAWETFTPNNNHDHNNKDNKQQLLLELPHAIDHRFFVKGAPECFRGSLFQKDDDDDKQDEDDEAT